MPRSEDLAQRAKFIYEKADSEGRGLYKTEQAEVNELVGMIDGQKKLEARMEQIDPTIADGVRAGDGSGRPVGNDPGAAFVQSEGYKRVQNSATRGPEMEHRRG